MTKKKNIEDFEKGDTYKILPKDENGENEIVPLKYALGFMVLSKEPYNPQLKSLGETYQNKHRYYYYEKFNDDANKKEALFIMFNPSKANPKNDDQTIKNCRKLVQDEYKSMEIINLFSERNPKVKEIDNDINGETNKLNNEFIKTLLKERQKANWHIILAWGAKKVLNEDLFEILRKFEHKYKLGVKDKNQAKYNFREDIFRHPDNRAWCKCGGIKNAELEQIKNKDLDYIINNAFKKVKK
jgi:hypothetical protein